MANGIIDNFITLFTTFPFNVIIIVAIFAFIYYEFFHKKKKDDEFQIEDFRESVFTHTDKLMKSFGITINCSLMRGIEPIGKVFKFYRYNGKVVRIDPDSEDKEEKDVDLYIFQIGQETFINKIIGGNYKEFVVVEKDHMEKYDSQKKAWAMKEEVSLVPYGNVFVSSENAKAFIQDISFKRQEEEILTHTQNFPRKVAYLELKQAKQMERLESSLEKKGANYEKWKREVLSSGKDIEGEGEDE